MYKHDQGLTLLTSGGCCRSWRRRRQTVEYKVFECHQVLHADDNTQPVQLHVNCSKPTTNMHTLTLLLLPCAKSRMLSASRRQPHLLHVSAVDRRQTWSMDKSWRCVTLSGFLHSHIVRCRWNPISCGTHYSGPGLSENDSAVTTDVCEDQNREVRLWGLPLKCNWPP